MKVSIGVLQGDCLSPLLFNMIINTFIKSLKQEKFEHFGVRVVKGRNWFQFADDAAATTSLESENQLLLNLFSRWCSWADMSIRSGKCHSFGLKKIKTASTQFKPKVYINNKLVEAIDAGESFIYLGRHFDYEMSKKSLTTTLKEYVLSFQNFHHMDQRESRQHRKPICEIVVRNTYIWHLENNHFIET